MIYLKSLIKSHLGFISVMYKQAVGKLGKGGV
jgi:hypothetical protein